MLKIIKMELYKFKHSKLLWIIPGAIILSLVLIILEQVGSETPVTLTWNIYFLRNEETFNTSVISIIFAVITGFIIAREYQYNTIDTVLCYPYSRIQLILSKILTMLPIIVVTFILFFGVVLVSGLLFCQDSLTYTFIGAKLRLYLILSLIHFSIVPITALVANLSRNVIPAAFLGIVSFIEFPGLRILPWNLLSIIIKWQYQNIYVDLGYSAVVPDLTPRFIYCIFWFILFCILNMYYYKNMNISNPS